MWDLDIFQTWFLVYVLFGLLITELNWRKAIREEPETMKKFTPLVKCFSYVTCVAAWPFLIIYASIKRGK